MGFSKRAPWRSLSASMRELSRSALKLRPHPAPESSATHEDRAPAQETPCPTHRNLTCRRSRLPRTSAESSPNPLSEESHRLRPTLHVSLRMDQKRKRSKRRIQPLAPCEARTWTIQTRRSPITHPSASAPTLYLTSRLVSYSRVGRQKGLPFCYLYSTKHSPFNKS